MNQILSGESFYQDANGLEATLNLENISTIARPHFVDYLHNGWKFSLVGAIDYTASNGNPADPSSLHYCGPMMN